MYQLCSTFNTVVQRWAKQSCACVAPTTNALNNNVYVNGVGNFNVNVNLNGNHNGNGEQS